MAGAKETPRQKLISLMYLVLLAMLALQVSGAIIQKFVYLNSSMEASVSLVELANRRLVDDMEAQVEKNKNQPGDLEVLKKAKLIREETRKAINYIGGLKKVLVKETGGVDEDGNFVGAKEEEAVAQYFLGSGDSKKGEGYALKKKLNEYTLFANSMGGSMQTILEFGQLALDGKEDPLFKNDVEQRNKDFAHLNFESTPMIAALAVLTEKEQRILTMESQMLTSLANEIGLEKLNVDRLRPVVKNRSIRVVAGTEYEAEMFMAAYSSNLKPKMTFGSQDIEVDGQGVGKVSFKASGGDYDQNGLLKKVWKGSITFPKSDGTDSVYQVSQEYYVVKPVIEAITDVKPLLFKDCGNSLAFKCPALGSDFNPVFHVSGGKKISGNQPGNIKIVPNSPNVKVKVNSNGIFIGELDYKVKLVPKAEISTNLDVRNGISTGDLRKVQVKVKMPDDFREVLPNDSRVKVKRFKIYLNRGKNNVLTKTVNGGEARLSEFVNKARPGDRVLIEVLEVQRRTFDDRNVAATPDVKFINVSIVE